jgi:hypothetical protein
MDKKIEDAAFRLALLDYALDTVMKIKNKSPFIVITDMIETLDNALMEYDHGNYYKAFALLAEGRK